MIFVYLSLKEKDSEDVFKLVAAAAAVLPLLL